MHADHDHARYAPTAIGALMDPGFLRRAANDACASRHGEAQTSNRRSGMLIALRAEAALLSALLRDWQTRRHGASASCNAQASSPSANARS